MHICLKRAFYEGMGTLDVQWFSPPGSVRAERVPLAHSAVRLARTGAERRP